MPLITARKSYKKGWITKQELRDSVVISGNCWEWKYSNTRNAYGDLRRHRKHWAAHRISYFLFKKDAPLGVLDNPDLLVCHHCDNPPCINPRHLFLGTHVDNVNDKVSKKRQVHGIRVWKSKITENDVVTIFKLRAEGFSYKEIAIRFNLHPRSLGAIFSRTNWKHVHVDVDLINNK